MTTILGIIDSHESSACIFKDGKVVAALSEERLNRIKGYALFPKLAIQKVMEMADVKGHEIDLVTVGMTYNTFDTRKAQEGEYRKRVKLISAVSGVLPSSFLSSNFTRQTYRLLTAPRRRTLFFKENTKLLHSIGISTEKIRFYDHHECHAATAYYQRPWKEKTLVFTIDGEGDGLCATVSVGEGNRLTKKVSISAFNSLGSMYSRTTKYLGMKPWEHEYKVMGMAPYAKAKYGEKTFEIFEKFIKVYGLGFKNQTGKVGPQFEKMLHKELKGHRFDNVSYGLQKLAEETITKWIENNVNHFGINKIAMAGGVVLNVKANKKIAELDCVDKCFFYPAAGDYSTSIGSAILGYRDLCAQDGKKFDVETLTTLYYGPSYDDELDSFVKQLNKRKYKVEMYKDIDGVVGKMVAKGSIIARCTGAMEFGPRALGNRSILANATSIKTVQKINSMIKFRDFWMPFTPSMVSGRENDYIVNPKGHDAYYMIQAFDSKPETRDNIIASIHQADKTTRPQVVEKEWNPGYYKVLKAYERVTGIGSLLNTSLNLHGEPIVCTPVDAIHTLKNSKLNYVALGNYLISKA